MTPLINNLPNYTHVTSLLASLDSTTATKCPIFQTVLESDWGKNSVVSLLANNPASVAAAAVGSVLLTRGVRNFISSINSFFSPALQAGLGATMLATSNLTGEQKAVVAATFGTITLLHARYENNKHYNETKKKLTILFATVESPPAKEQRPQIPNSNSVQK